LPQADVERARKATGELVSEMMKFERRSWELRRELASSTLHMVVDPSKRTAIE
jgi:hypothetical protein